MLEEALGDVEPEAAVLGRRRFGVGDVAEVGHLRQHLVAALAGAGGVEDRVVVGRRLRQAGQHRRLGQAQLPDRLGEVDPRRRLDADRGAAVDRPVGGRVQVLAEDFVLRVALRVLDRQLRLDDLAFEVVLGVGDAEVADELLGDRRAALDRFACFEVLDRRPQDRFRVDPAVLVETLVLDRDRRLAQLHRHPPQGDRRARLLGGDDPEFVAVAVVEDRVAAFLDRFAGGERGGVGGDVEHPGGDPDRERHEQGEDRAADEQHLAGCAAAAPVASAPLAHRRKGTQRRAALRPACPRSSGCGGCLRPEAGWGSRSSCRRRD